MLLTLCMLRRYTSGQDMQIGIKLFDLYGQPHPGVANPRRTDTVTFSIEDPLASGQLQAQVGPQGSCRP